MDGYIVKFAIKKNDLPALFGKESEINPEDGLLDVFITLDRQEQPDLLEHIVRLSDTDELYCLPAGVFSANYARIAENYL